MLRQLINDAVRDVPQVPNVDLAKLLYAISLVESDGGGWNAPRHEDGFCPNQRGFNVNNIVRARHRQWGCLSCCSWGPFQQLYHSAADLGFDGDPNQLTIFSVATYWASRQLKRIIERGAKSIADIADSWNSGTFKDGNKPVAYIQKVITNYDRL